MTATAEAPTQTAYEVRFDWGVSGVGRVAPGAGVIVIVDALEHGTAAVRALEDEPDAAALAAAANAPLSAAAAAFDVPVIAASLRNRSAVVRWILDHQVARGDRVRVAVVAAGNDASSPGFDVADLLTAGAVIDALAELGIDYSSPEAAAACAAFTGLRRAAGHLLTASVAGQALIAGGRRDAVVAAGQLDASEVVPLLGEGGYASA